jgi:hypothetical protein
MRVHRARLNLLISLPDSADSDPYTVLHQANPGYIVVSHFHAAREAANNHPVVFAEYAGSGTAVHLGQFVGMAILLAGLLALFFALDVQTGTARWAGRFGAALTVATGSHTWD